MTRHQSPIRSRARVARTCRGAGQGGPQRVAGGAASSQDPRLVAGGGQRARARSQRRLSQCRKPPSARISEKLEADGHIARQHGGAFLRTVPQQVETLSLQHRENMDKKRKIGLKAASLVLDGETIILDAGSTTTEIAHNLLGRSALTVITNALNIALLLGARAGLRRAYAGWAIQGADTVAEWRQGGRIFPGRLCRQAVSRHRRRRARHRPHLSELRRLCNSSKR